MASFPPNQRVQCPHCFWKAVDNVQLQKHVRHMHQTSADYQTSPKAIESSKDQLKPSNAVPAVATPPAAAPTTPRAPSTPVTRFMAASQTQAGLTTAFVAVNSSSRARFRYACNQCDKTFAHATALKDHVAAIHDQVRNFFCPFTGCDYSVTKNSNLKRHLTSSRHDLREVQAQRIVDAQKEALIEDADDEAFDPVPERSVRKVQTRGRAQSRQLPSVLAEANSKPGVRLQNEFGRTPLPGRLIRSGSTGASRATSSSAVDGSGDLNV